MIAISRLLASRPELRRQGEPQPTGRSAPAISRAAFPVGAHAVVLEVARPTPAVVEELLVVVLGLRGDLRSMNAPSALQGGLDVGRDVEVHRRNLTI
jgi:hypothetical protein